jgi:hypothetical protein
MNGDQVTFYKTGIVDIYISRRIVSGSNLETSSPGDQTLEFLNPKGTGFPRFSTSSPGDQTL